MSFLTSDKAPFILVLLLTAAGWQASQLHGEVQTYRNAASYEMTTDDANVTRVDVRNESRTTSLRGVRFMVFCEQLVSCFAHLPRGEGQDHDVFGMIGYSGAASSQVTFVEDSPDRVIVIANVPPDGRFILRAQLRAPEIRPVFRYMSDDEAQPNVYLYDRATFVGWVVKNYFLILWACFLLTLGSLVAYVIMSGILRRAEPAAGPQGGTLKSPAKKKKSPTKT